MHHLFIIIILEILVLIVITPSNNYHLTIIYFNARLTLKKNISPFVLLKFQEVMHYLCVGGYKEKLIGKNKQQQQTVCSSVKMAYTRVFFERLTPFVFLLSSVLQSAYRQFHFVSIYVLLFSFSCLFLRLLVYLFEFLRDFRSVNSLANLEIEGLLGRSAAAASARKLSRGNT